MNQPNRVRLSKLSLALIAVLAAAPAFAQNTSAGIGGRVLDASGRPVAGAEVTIVHTESGTVSKVVTDAEGRYNARGLRVGGPYTITATKAGAGTSSEDGVYLNLGTVTQVDTQLRGDVTTLETVEAVAGDTSEVFSADKVGAGTLVSRDVLEGFFSLNRDLQDYARLDPRISQTDKERGEISAGGQNTRYNSITIDRVSTNDTFGLESNNLPTIRQPISIDSIEEVQVNVTNYDVTQKGYTGANINAVTKSGTNEFHGSAYYVYREADWVGDGANNRPFTGFKEDWTYGATLGGPIVRDRLFFFANYEKSELSAPGGDSGPVGSGASNIVGNITLADVTRVQQIAQGYGLTAGGLSAGEGTKTTSETALVKLDWNINDAHRASLRVNKTEQDEAILPGFGTNFFSLSSHWYNQQKEFTNYVAEWFGDWSDNFSTEASVAFRDYHSEPRTFGRQPQVQVNFAGGQSLRFGTEQFRHANVLDTETWTGFFAGNLFLGDHELKFGVDYERNEIYNLFVESAFGTYTFNSLTDFQNGRYRDYALRVPSTGNMDDAAAQAEFANTGLFVQDTWMVNPNLTLQFGLRYDTLGVDGVPRFNAAASTTFGYRNDETVDGKSLLQPRFGFNYTFDAERPTQLRGGVGLFQGAAANVWLVNPYTNNGLSISVFGCGSGFSSSCAAAPLFNPSNPPRIGSARADVDFLHPDLEQPAVWKANLAFEHELPWWNTVFSVEGVLFSVENGIYYQHLNLGAPTAVGKDGRQLYWRSTAPANYQTSNGNFNGIARSNANTAYREVLLAAPTNKGEGQNLTVSLSKPLGREDRWGWSLAYSYTDATDASPLTSSRSISNWASRASFNPNEEVAARSNYVVRDRFVGTLRFREQFFGDNDTEISLFYEGRSGKPFSWTFQNDMNGDGLAGNDLMYIPAGPGDVIFRGGAAEEAEFWAYVSQHPELMAARGGVVERSSGTAPWVNTFDLRVRQEFPGFFEGHKSELVLDVFNVGNLINKDWGQVEEIFFQSNGGQARSFVNFAGIDPATGRYIYTLVRNSSGQFTPEGFGLRDRRGESRWAAQLTFRYKF
ncbi:TonB-dependent receptor [Vulcaniibacterium gelatinicum]|uniref:TonB-dependent receptor n=1 Tax=Vulcaniibacterium gelatinicum TaxID=2598725 RepID=UPI0011CB0FAC|nr:TonB-dependent receptor [Vulcaniibacterium gelatinicum]